MKHTRTSRSFVPAALAALGAALLVSASAAAEVRPVNAGPLWNNAHATRTCPNVCARAGATWTQHWRTIVWGRMSVCDCNFPSATPVPTPTPEVVPPPAAPNLSIGRYAAQHPHWSGFVTLNADRTYARDNGDPGTWTYDGTTLVLAWRNWAPETLTRQADGSFRAASNGFTLRFAGAAPVAAPAPTMTPGRYTAQHPHWSGFITLNADRTYARDNGDPGTWTYDGTTLVLAWRNWAPETLTRQADGSFRAASNGFTIRFAGN